MNSHSTILSLVATGMLGILPAATTTAGTVAYYRFETGRAGQSLGSTANHLILDSSGHGFSLDPYADPVVSTLVPADPLPLTNEKNRSSVHFAGNALNPCSPLDSGLNRIVFTSFTIEAWVYFDRLDDWQTLVGRDDTGSPGEGRDFQSLFYLSKTTNTKPAPGMKANGMRVELVTRDNRLLAINSTLGVVAQTWFLNAAPRPQAPAG